MWTRLTVPVVAGEEPSPLQRTAAAADFGNGVSRILDFESHVFINPDLTVALSRVPDRRVDRLRRGVPAVRRRIRPGREPDLRPRGPVGRAVQSLLVERR